jgi:hypothetical protein
LAKVTSFSKLPSNLPSILKITQQPAQQTVKNGESSAILKITQQPAQLTVKNQRKRQQKIAAALLRVFYGAESF